MKTLPLEKRQLCDIQGRLFELAQKSRYDCPLFIENFMNSRAAAALDDVYDRLQWAGEEYILEELNDEVHGLKKAGITYSIEVMYWTGYIYRYWHYYTNEGSHLNIKSMKAKPAFVHGFDVEMAIDDLKEIHEQNQITENTSEPAPFCADGGGMFPAVSAGFWK